MIHFAIYLLYFEYLLNNLKDITSKSEILIDFSSFSTFYKSDQTPKISFKQRLSKACISKVLFFYNKSTYVYCEKLIRFNLKTFQFNFPVFSLT
jgi:hypothetical protein